MNFGDIISSISKYVPSLGARRPKREKEMAADVRPKPLGTPTLDSAMKTSFPKSANVGLLDGPKVKSEPAQAPVFRAPAVQPSYDMGETPTPFRPFDQETLDLRVKKAWAGFKAAYPDTDPSPGVLMAVASHPKIPTNGIFNAFPIEARDAINLEQMERFAARDEIGLLRTAVYDQYGLSDKARQFMDEMGVDIPGDQGRFEAGYGLGAPGYAEPNSVMAYARGADGSSGDVSLSREKGYANISTLFHEFSHNYFNEGIDKESFMKDVQAAAKKDKFLSAMLSGVAGDKYGDSHLWINLAENYRLNQSNIPKSLQPYFAEVFDDDRLSAAREQGDQRTWQEWQKAAPKELKEMFEVDPGLKQDYDRLKKKFEPGMIEKIGGAIGRAGNAALGVVDTLQKPVSGFITDQIGAASENDEELLALNLKADLTPEEEQRKQELYMQSADFSGGIKNVGDDAAKLVAKAAAQKAAVKAKEATSLTKTRGLSLSVQEKAVANGLAENLGDLPTYDVRKIEPNAKKVVKRLADDADTAIKIALGDAEAPSGLFPEEFFVAVSKKAAADGDVGLLKQLANSKLAGEGTVMGQRIRALGELNPEEPVTIIKKVQQVRKAKADKGMKIPTDLADDEIKAIATLSNAVQEAKAKAPADTPAMDYGRSLVALEDYVGGLKNPRAGMTARELIGDISKEEVISTLKHPWRLLAPAADLSKAVKATWDNSFAGRQGRKLLTTSPKQWTKEFGESWVDLFKTARYNNDDVMRELRANVYATPEYRAGNYKHLDINIKEEDIPTTLQGKIPVIGRFFRASDTAYSAMALKTRVWAMDEALAIGRALGEDMTDDWMKGAARYANVMGGRGRLGKLEPIASTLNRGLFSPRNATAHLDFLSAHLTDPTVPTVLKKKAARNLLQWGIGNATVLSTAAALGYSVEWDTRSSNFGTIRVGSRRIDVTGGAKGYVTLIARLGAWLASYKDEDIGVYKSSTTDEMMMGADARKFGGRTAEDVTVDFLSNKSAPVGTVILDVLRGVDFKGEPITLPGEIKNLGVPIMAEQSSDLDATPGEEGNKALMLLLEFSGFSVQNYLAPDNPLIKLDKEFQEDMTEKDENGDDALTTAEKFEARFHWREEIRPELGRLAGQKNKAAAAGWSKFLDLWDERNADLEADNYSPDSEDFPKEEWDAALEELTAKYPKFAAQWQQIPKKLILR